MLTKFQKTKQPLPANEAFKLGAHDACRAICNDSPYAIHKISDAGFFRELHGNLADFADYERGYNTIMQAVYNDKMPVSGVHPYSEEALNA